MSTEAQVLRIDPTLAGDSRIAAELAVVAGQLSRTQFGSRYSEAVAALTAHRLRYSPENGTGMAPGLVSSVKTGKRNVNFAQPSVAASTADDAALRTTVGGAYFLQLRTMSPRIMARVLL